MRRLTIGIILTTILLPLVSAQSFPSVGEAVQSAIDSLREILSPIFEALLNTSSYDEFFFTKMLLLFLLFIVISASLKKFEFFEKTKGLPIVVAAIISLLAVRYISDEGILSGILLPYGALGISMIVFIPFLVYFWFLHLGVQSGFGRRIAWILYGIVFFVLWIARFSDISTELNWVYGLGILAILAALAFDKNLHGYFKVWEINAFYRGATQRTIAALQAEYLNIINVDSKPASDRRASIERQLRHLGADVP